MRKRSSWASLSFLGILLPLVLLVSCSAETLTVPRSTHFILDASGSMYGLKFEAAKGALAAHVRKLAVREEAGLVVLGNRGCDATELKVPLGSADQSGIIDELETIDVDGPTPLALALRDAGDDLAEVAEGDKTIIVFTDGGETCGGDPCAEARRLRDGGVTVHLVGFAPVDDLTRVQYDCITETTGGVYFNLTDPQDISTLLGSLACETCAIRDGLILGIVTLVLSLAGAATASTLT